MADQLDIKIPYEHNTLTNETGPEAFQWWYFDAEFEQGYTALLVILPRTIGIIDGYEMDASSCMVWITITTPDGQSLAAKRVYPAAALSATSTGLDASLGANHVRFNGESYFLEFEEGDLAAQLRVTPVLPPWSPLGDKSRMDPELLANLGIESDYYFDYVEFLPRGIAEGVLRIKNKSIKVTGIGYHEQGYGNFHLGRMMENWFWTKHYFDEYTMVLAGGTLSEQFGNALNYGFMLAKGNRIIASQLDMMGMFVNVERLEEKVLPQTKESYPSKVAINVNCEEVSVEAEISYLFLREGLGFDYTSNAFKPKSKPTWLQYVSETDAKITIGKSTERKKGRGIFEVMKCG